MKSLLSPFIALLCCSTNLWLPAIFHKISRTQWLNHFWNKDGLDTSQVKNYRQVSNLSLKRLERVAQIRLQNFWTVTTWCRGHSRAIVSSIASILSSGRWRRWSLCSEPTRPYCCVWHRRPRPSDASTGAPVRSARRRPAIVSLLSHWQNISSYLRR